MDLFLGTNWQQHSFYARTPMKFSLAVQQRERIW